MSPALIALQLFILVAETYVRWNVTSNKAHRRMKGYWAGLGCQFLWLIVFLSAGQYFLLPLLVLDGGIWLRGLVSHQDERN